MLLLYINESSSAMVCFFFSIFSRIKFGFFNFDLGTLGFAQFSFELAKFAANCPLT